MRPAFATLATITTIATLLAAPAARANDSEAVLEGGNLTLKKSDGVVMESEELEIGENAVSVSYVFRNTTAADVATRVAFPMAPYPFEEGELQAEALAEARKRSWHDFGNFSVVVDGKPIEFETSAKVTPRTATVTHHWTQSFPAGKAVSVKHQFTPRGGFIYSPLDQSDGLAREYCVGPVLIRALKAKNASITQVHYILRTGANWKGPIGRFLLRIKKSNPKQKVSVCMDGFSKPGPQTFLLEKKDFVPTQDLKIAFINTY